MRLERFLQGELVSGGRGQLEFGRLVPNLQHVEESIACWIPARTTQSE